LHSPQETSMLRKAVTSTLIGALALALPLSKAAANAAVDYPNKPINLVVPFAPGGGTDVQARLVAKALEEVHGQPVVVSNRPGAAGGIGARAVATAKPDGYTLLFATTSLASESALNDNASFNLLEDLIPVSIVTDVPFMMVV